MNKMETPEKTILVHDIMYQPATEIQGQHTNNNSTKDIGAGPIDNTKLAIQAPVRQFDNQDGNACMQDEMNDGEYKVHSRMPQLVFFVPHWQKGNGTFNKPKEQQTANQQSHSFQRPFLKRRKICNDPVPHTQVINAKSYEEKIVVS